MTDSFSYCNTCIFYFLDIVNKSGLLLSFKFLHISEARIRKLAFICLHTLLLSSNLSLITQEIFKVVSSCNSSLSFYSTTIMPFLHDIPICLNSGKGKKVEKVVLVLAIKKLKIIKDC